MAGIYIHIPFCKTRCTYCDFFSTTLLSRRDDYVRALCQEADQRLANIAAPVQTVYFGGGTPSLLSAAHIQRIISRLPIAADTEEITLEANPGDLTATYLRDLRRIGINRLSIGIQSFDDEVLRFIGRRHTAAEAVQAVRTAQNEGFDNISIDLIYGIPSHNSDPLLSLQQQIDTALSLDIQHISTYCLTYEEGTPITRLIENGTIEEVDEDTENAMYDLISSRLTAAGFEHYEVSNFALPGHRSRHNGNYWNRTPYIGLGAGAHSYDGNSIRSWHPDNLDQYINNPVFLHQERLTPTDLYNERIMLGLRTAEGILLRELHNPQKALSYIEQGLLQLTDNQRIVATLSGSHILNRIIEDLMD